MRTEKLGDLVSITGGGTPDRSNGAFWGGDVPWVTVKDFKSLEISGATEHITAAGLEGSASNLIPAGSIIVMVPVLLAAGLPVEGMGILLGVDTIPDMFRTTANVTGDMVAASVLSRGERDEAPPGPAAA